MVLRDAVAGLLGPGSCLGCGRARSLLCRPCAAGLARAPWGSSVPHADRVLSPWAYEGAARSLILALKVEGLRAAAAPLAAAMATEAIAVGVEASVLAWVPGRARDRRRRGFDHAEVLGRAVARRLGLAARPLVGRAREPPDQASLPAAARRRNLTGVFAAPPCRVPVVLVDDVVTTGATATACAAALRGAGCPGVEVLAACRAAHPAASG
jgi:predicted amidophosphoribosyltransferase